MRDPGGDLASMGLGTLVAQPGKGLSPDAMRQAAAQAGYLGADIGQAMSGTRVNDLLDAIGADRPPISVHDADAAHTWDTYDELRAGYDRMSDRSRPAAPQRAPLSAYRQEDAYPAGMAPSQRADPPLSPNFDQAAAGRVKAASAAMRERAETFDSGPVGGALRNQGSASNFRLMDAKVPDALVQAGPQGAQVAKAYFKAVGDDAGALADFKDAAALAIRKAAVKDGVVDPGKLDGALAKYTEALSTVPDLRKQFETAGAASETFAQIAAARRANLDAIQKTAFGKLVQGQDPGKVIGSILGSPTAPAQMRKLAQAASGSPDAAMGLRKAVADFMTARLVSNTEAATSGKNLLKNDQFQTFVRQNRPALGQVFSDKELGLIQAIADDLHRSNRSITAIKLPGGSNTAQDTEALRQGAHAPQGSMLTKIMAGAGAGFAAHGPVGAALGGAGAVGQHVLGGLRDAGMRKVDDLVRDAMLDPDLARALLAKAPIAPGRGSEVTLAHQLRRVTLLGAVNGAAQGHDSKRPTLH